MKNEIKKILDETLLNEETKNAVTAQLLDLFTNDKPKSVEDEMGKYLAVDIEHFPKVIVALKKALKNKPDAMVDNIVFDIGTNDEYEEESITMWEPLEYSFTVKEFCELIGLE